MVLVHNRRIENVWWKKVTEVTLELEFWRGSQTVDPAASYRSQWYHAMVKPWGQPEIGEGGDTCVRNAMNNSERVRNSEMQRVCFCFAACHHQSSLRTLEVPQLTAGV